MTVFDSRTRIKHASAWSKDDRRLPGSRSLDWRQIAGPSALGPTSGHHCELVHGDHWEETNGLVSESFQKDRATMIGGNHSLRVGRNQTVLIADGHKETLGGFVQQTYVGPHIVFNGDVRNETRLGAHTEVYGKQEVHDDANGKLLVGVDHDERFILSTALHGLDVQSFGMALSLVGATIPIVGLNVSAKLVLDYSLALVHTEFTGVHTESHLRQTEDHDGPPGI